MTLIGNRLLAAIPADHRGRLIQLTREVEFPAGTRIFAEGGRADHFWTIDSGSVALDLHVPGRPAATVETLGPGDLLGWSWLLPPYRWHLGAVAVSPVHAEEFDAAAVRALCDRGAAAGVSSAAPACGLISRCVAVARRGACR